ncbi:hypothetical protein TNCV_3492971 [Trichonephila clavipes]|nr:hypothetical protein TNCV_3492971 [Trichonephila clavipes]
MEGYDHTLFPPTPLGRQDGEEVTSGGSHSQIIEKCKRLYNLRWAPFAAKPNIFDKQSILRPSSFKSCNIEKASPCSTLSAELIGFESKTGTIGNACSSEPIHDLLGEIWLSVGQESVEEADAIQ